MIGRTCWIDGQVRNARPATTVTYLRDVVDLSVMRLIDLSKAGYFVKLVA